MICEIVKIYCANRIHITQRKGAYFVIMFMATFFWLRNAVTRHFHSDHCKHSVQYCKDMLEC